MVNLVGLRFGVGSLLSAVLRVCGRWAAGNRASLVRRFVGVLLVSALVLGLLPGGDWFGV